MRTDIEETSNPRPEAHPQMLLTVPQTARTLALGRTKVYELIASGELEVVHIGRAARVPTDAIASFVARHRRGPGRDGALD